MAMNWRAGCLALVLMLMAGPLLAQPSWRELDAAQKAQFARYAGKWDQMSDAQKTRLIENYRRWQAMSPEQRRQARDKFAQEIQALSDAEREALRDCYRRRQAGEEVECARSGEKP